MRLNIVSPSIVPERPYVSELFCLPTAAVPWLLKGIALLSSPYWYTTDADYERGRSLLSETAGGLLMPCGTEIVHAVNRLEAALAAAVNGTARTVEGTGTAEDPYIFTPPLPTEFDPSDYLPPSLRSDVNVTRALLDNLTNGTTSAVAPDPRNFRQQLEDIKLALENAGLESDDIEELLNLILLALA